MLVLLSGVSYRDREITGPRLRDLLALLAGDLRAGCSAARLVAGIWPDEQPENPTKALQILVSRTRAQLGSDVIATTPTGYRLALAEDQVDTSAVLLSASASAQHARAGDHAAALAHAEAGLALWPGDGDAGPTESDDPVAALRAERTPAYRSLLRARALALSRLGRRAEAVEPLTGLATRYPRDEEVLGELLRCEAATVGPGAALTRYDAYRRALRDELGADPGTALLAVHQQLLQATEPALRSGVAHEPNALLGRGADIAAVAALLGTSRVTSIVGPGGLGKTRLAHVVSRQAEQGVVHLVALAGVTSDENVAGEIASALGVVEPPRAPTGRTDVVRGIAAALGSGPALLVLDNCEHVVVGAAELVRALVSLTRDVRVLTTSRTPLGLTSESVYPLPELDPATSVELFGRRARAARRDVELPAGPVAELCGHLDGLPLAIELAAARTRVMSVPEIAARLQDRFALLRGGPRDAPQRHRTLHAVVDWSWNLLDSSGQAALRALSVFPGGFTADAAGRVLDGARTEDAVLVVLEHLVDQSLLKAVDTGSGTRFRMLETVREFSSAHRDAAAETDPVTSRFLGWARDFGVAHHDAPLGADPFGGAERVRVEQDNLVHALRCALASDDGSTVVAIAAALGSLWTFEMSNVRMASLAAEIGDTLAHHRPEPRYVEATRTISTLCTATTFMLSGRRATRALVALRRLPPAPPDTLLRAFAVVLADRELLDPDRARLRELCARPEPFLAGVATVIASYVWESEGRFADALVAAERMMAPLERVANPWMLAIAHARVSEVLHQAERGTDALRQAMAAVHQLESVGAASLAGQFGWSIVLADLSRGALDEAARRFARIAPDTTDADVTTYSFAHGVDAELRLAGGDVPGGLRLWRRAADRLAQPLDEPGLSTWTLEVQAVTVIAHVRHGRLGDVPDLVEELARTLPALLTDPGVQVPSYLAGFPVCGAVLLALGTADLAAGRDPAACARLIALAERLHFLRNFQPTMSGQRARHAAERADRPAYEDAVSRYAGLGPDELLAATLAALRARG